MEYSETEKQMLREILPGIATQLRGSLANIHAALGRLAPEQARDASTDTDRSAAILCQSYYRILRVVNNLSDAPMLAEEKPLDTENVELVRFLDGLCRQGEALAQLMELRLNLPLRTGVSDDSYTEIKSGLQEDDTVAYDTSSVSDDYYSDSYSDSIW